MKRKDILPVLLTGALSASTFANTLGVFAQEEQPQEINQGEIKQTESLNNESNLKDEDSREIVTAITETSEKSTQLNNDTKMNNLIPYSFLNNIDSVETKKNVKVNEPEAINVVEVTIGEDTKEYTSFDNAIIDINKQSDAATIKLLANVQTTNQINFHNEITFIGGEYQLNVLNNNLIIYSNFTIESGSINFSDDPTYRFFVDSSACLTMNGGTINRVWLKGACDLNGGTIQNLLGNGTLNKNGGTVLNIEEFSGITHNGSEDLSQAGDFRVEGGEKGIDWDFTIQNDGNSPITIKNSGSYTITGNGTAAKDYQINVEPNVTCKLTLNNVNIEAKYAGMNINGNANVTLNLIGNNRFVAGNVWNAGIQFNDNNNKLIINSDGTGTLYVKGRRGAGIGTGGGGGSSNDTIEILGGTITSLSNSNVGIGHSTCNVVIAGGSVKGTISGKPTDANGNAVYLAKIDRLSGVNNVTVDENQNFTRAGDHPDGDGSFYLYLTGQNHTITANGKTYAVSWNDESENFDVEDASYSASVTPNEVTLPSVKEGYDPQDPEYITIKNTGNQTIKLEDHGKNPWLVITLDKNTLKPNEEAKVSIKLKDGLSAETRSTLKGFITYTSEDGTYREHAHFEVTYEIRHDMKHVEAKEATHLEEGNIEYWYCEYCDKYYDGALGTNELSLEDITIPKLTDHTATDTWYHDENSHWHTCECGEVLDKEAHEFKWVIDKEATATSEGLKHEECSICGYQKEAIVIPVVGTENQPPVINAKDQTLTVGDKFDPMKGVIATDQEDGDLTDKIVITKNTVDTSKAGKYTVYYEVTDNGGVRVRKTIVVTVKEKSADQTSTTDSKKTNGTNTSANLGIGLFSSLAGLSVVGAGILSVLKKRNGK